MGLTRKEILSTEYSTKFDTLRKKAVVMSYYKYGPAKENYDTYKCMKAVEDIKKRLVKYEETGNTEFLVDVANFAMLEFMYPSHPNAYYSGTEADICELAGFSVNEIKSFQEGN